ncbi:hypothetical protein [Sphingomonas sp. IC081]|uniref:hypothetical protein n=1 Tax=Sphingomonas sp. IC081 TaxID=304378 RepID=UPI00115A10F5|nr:hypothetical protein [Sphingomonas sp. IC081]QDK32662.1 hypothetical protein DM450_07670 [Sphingomonas sp. IC081]
MKKFLKWGVGLVVIGFVGLAGVGKAVALHEDYQLFRTNLDELQGVKIGETQEEILYELGNPFMVQKADVDAEKPDAAGFRIVEPDGSLRDGKNFRDYPIWEWSAQDGTVSVAAKFDPETKKVIRVNCRAGTDASATQLVCITVSMVGLGTDNNRINPFYR